MFNVHSNIGIVDSLEGRTVLMNINLENISKEDWVRPIMKRNKKLIKWLWFLWNDIVIKFILAQLQLLNESNLWGWREWSHGKGSNRSWDGYLLETFDSLIYWYNHNH